MEHSERIDSAALIRLGLRELVTHRPDKAIVTFRRAVDAIPPACSEELSRALYWLSVALMRLDKKDLAIRSLASAQKLRRRGYARRVYLRAINEYGMPKQPTPELDDFYAFMNLQMAAYLTRKIRTRFESFNERDTVFRLLIDAWKTIGTQGLLNDKSCGEKLIFFRKLRPDFPNFGITKASGIVLRPTFGTGPRSSTAFDPAARCVCGSGLSYLQCCGRISGLSELQ